jgi:hypothetical protein
MPAAAKRRATSAPMPRDAPVINATLPLNDVPSVTDAMLHPSRRRRDSSGSRHTKERTDDLAPKNLIDQWLEIEKSRIRFG